MTDEIHRCIVQLNPEPREQNRPVFFLEKPNLLVDCAVTESKSIFRLFTART